MDIQAALKQEEARLQKQLRGIQGAIAAINGGHSARLSSSAGGSKSVTRKTAVKRTMSAAARARISKATKERWAKFRANELKKAK